jgi:hypothetical protein
LSISIHTAVVFVALFSPSDNIVFAEEQSVEIVYPDIATPGSNPNKTQESNSDPFVEETQETNVDNKDNYSIANIPNNTLEEDNFSQEFIEPAKEPQATQTPVAKPPKEIIKPDLEAEIPLPKEIPQKNKPKEKTDIPQELKIPTDIPPKKPILKDKDIKPLEKDKKDDKTKKNFDDIMNSMGGPSTVTSPKKTAAKKSGGGKFGGGTKNVSSNGMSNSLLGKCQSEIKRQVEEVWSLDSIASGNSNLLFYLNIKVAKNGAIIDVDIEDEDSLELNIRRSAELAKRAILKLRKFELTKDVFKDEHFDDWKEMRVMFKPK